MRLWLVALLAALAGTPAYANTSACWWMADDPSHPELSCAPLTQAFLVGLEGASRKQVVAAMGAPGSPDAGGILRFESNYAFRRRGYSGAVVVTFGPDGRVKVIDAAVDAPHHKYGMKFVWNAEEPGCSDFPGSIQRCDNLVGAPRPLAETSPPSDATTRNGLLARVRRYLSFGS
jgi:hypothetical protein